MRVWKRFFVVAAATNWINPTFWNFTVVTACCHQTCQKVILKQIQRQRQRQLHLENNFKEWSLRLLTFETFDQSGEETWPDQQKDRQIHLENNFKVGFFRMKTFRDLTIKRECLLFIWHIPLAEACQGKSTWLDWLEAQTKGEQDEEEDFHFQGFPLKIKTKCWLRSCLKATGVSAHFPLSLIKEPGRKISLGWYHCFKSLFSFMVAMNIK